MIKLPGRPRLSRSRRRWRVIKVYVTPRERAQIQASGQRRNVSLAVLLRQSASEARPRVVPEIDPTAFASLCRIGTQLNEFMADINAGQPPAVSCPDLFELYGLLIMIHQDLRTASGTPHAKARE